MGSTESLDVQKVIDSSDVSTTQKRALALCLAFGVVDGIAAVMIGFVLPTIAREWDRSVASLTPVALVAPIAIALGALALSPIADVVGRRPFIMGGATVMGLFTLGAAAAPNALTLGAALFVAGLGFGAVPGAVYTYGAEMAPTRLRGTLVSVIGCGLTAGGVMCGLAAGLLVPEFGWRALFVVGGVLPLVLVVLSVRWLPETLQFMVIKGDRDAVIDGVRAIDGSVAVAREVELVQPKRDSSKSRIGALFADGRGGMTVAFFVLYFGQYMGALFIFTWLPSVLTTAGVGETLAVYASSAFPFGGMIGGVLLGMLVDRTGKKLRIFPLSFAVGAVGIAVSAYSVNIAPLLFVALFVAGFGVVGSGVASNPVVASLYPSTVRSTAIGWANGCGRVGSVIGPAVGGILLGMNFSAKSIFMFSLVPVVVCIGCAFLLRVVARSAELEANFAGSAGLAPTLKSSVES